MLRVRTDDGLELAYAESGRLDGRPLVLLHGLSGSSGAWASTAGAVAPRFRVLAVDQRGHGESGRTDDPLDFTLERLVLDVFNVSDALQASPIVLVGHGIGATVAMLAALEDPDRVDALVCVGASAAPLDPASGWMATRVRVAEAVQRGGIQAGWEAYLESGIFGWELDDIPAEIVGRWRKEFTRTAPAAFVGLAGSASSQPDLTPRLRKLRCPTLVVAGSDDQAFGPQAAALAEAIPGAELKVIPGGGHSPQMSRAEEFNETLVAFLKRALPSGR
ncbi:MAG TPA: alpha/beta hydrolase [Actinomycetota bacterium]|nr:alpha/beta hydrolase [Actinomycetota bacterium]